MTENEIEDNIILDDEEKAILDNIRLGTSDKSLSFDHLSTDTSFITSNKDSGNKSNINENEEKENDKSNSGKVKTKKLTKKEKLI
jgi:hypothetical protein